MSDHSLFSGFPVLSTHRPTKITVCKVCSANLCSKSEEHDTSFILDNGNFTHPNQPTAKQELSTCFRRLFKRLVDMIFLTP